MKPWCEDKDILVIARGEGDFLIDTEGRRYIDGTSSIWCNVHGHCVAELDAALKAQVDLLAHSTLLGLANVPSVLLAKRLVELVRGCGLGLDKVFYSDDGSTAVEVACKMAVQYWRNVGAGEKPEVGSQKPEDRRTRFMAFAGGYHGDTVGAVSVGGIPVFHQAFKSLCFGVDFAPSPREAGCLGRVEELLAADRQAYAGIVVEPLIQGAGGMIVQPAGFLRKLRELADRYGTLLIADEVMTGFGRTGKMFACEHEGVTPDLMCLSKGLTAGYMPLGVTLASRRVFEAFYADPRAGKTFFHGHTFTGHPLACAVALASLDLFARNGLLEHVGRMAAILGEALAAARGRPYVGDVRQVGLIGAIELLKDPARGEAFEYYWRVGGALCTRMRSLGLLMRPLGDVLVIMPPLAIREENMRRLCEGVLHSLEWLPEVVASKSREFSR